MRCHRAVSPSTFAMVAPSATTIASWIAPRGSSPNTRRRVQRRSALRRRASASALRAATCLSFCQPPARSSRSRSAGSSECIGLLDSAVPHLPSGLGSGPESGSRLCPSRHWVLFLRSATQRALRNTPSLPTSARLHEADACVGVVVGRRGSAQVLSSRLVGPHHRPRQRPLAPTIEGLEERA